MWTRYLSRTCVVGGPGTRCRQAGRQGQSPASAVAGSTVLFLPAAATRSHVTLWLTTRTCLPPLPRLCRSTPSAPYGLPPPP